MKKNAFKTLYRELDEIRAKKGVSWRKLSAECSVPPATFTRMKAGRTISVENLSKLFTTFHVSISELLS